MSDSKTDYPTGTLRARRPDGTYMIASPHDMMYSTVTAEALIAILIDRTRHVDSDNSTLAREHLRKASMYLRYMKKESTPND